MNIIEEILIQLGFDHALPVRPDSLLKDIGH